MSVNNPSPSLYNEDLAPAETRNWGAFSIFNVWTSDVHSLWGYYLAASLFLLCGSFINFVKGLSLSHRYTLDVAFLRKNRDHFYDLELKNRRSNREFYSIRFAKARRASSLEFPN